MTILSIACDVWQAQESPLILDKAIDGVYGLLIGDWIFVIIFLMYSVK